MQTFTLACFWFATMVYVYSTWLNWQAYKRWSKKYAALLKDEYLRELRSKESGDGT